ncbi:hypothetical protein RhiirC2_782008 [Rhizophagus irregularis]|uniref:Integrase catalytic domain-containing protein n=1 Tax=Rhizophagus irregularis TaxID=588596 RepID=A0A2N1N424_9GLOM|nr:hypothetical protein RhiirC2_782008 [Rhizophagus irregularis]
MRKNCLKPLKKLVYDWLEKQAVHQIHKPRPRYIPRASFCSITTPNKVHQANVLYMPYDKTIALEKIYDDPECPLVWPKTFLTDKGSEFRGDCEKLMREHSVKIQKAFTKDTMGITEKYNGDLTRKLFRPQDASDLLTLHMNKISRAWVRNLPIVVEYINNSITCQLGISPDDAIEKEEVLAKPSYPRDGPIGFDEKKLSGDVLVRYLLHPSDLEGGRRRAGDLNWSPHIYHIRQSMIFCSRRIDGYSL